MEWERPTKDPAIELTEKKPDITPRPDKPFEPVPSQPEILPEPTTFPGRQEPSPAPTNIATTEQSYSAMGTSLQDEFNTLSAKTSRLKDRLSASMMKKWNELNTKMKNLLQDINKRKVTIPEEQVRLLPQELKKTDETIRQIKKFNVDAFTDSFQQKIDDWLLPTIDQWLKSPAYKQQIELNQQKWRELKIDYPHQPYSIDPVLKQFVNSQDFQNSVFKQIARHVQDQNILLPDNLRTSPQVKTIIEQLSSIGFLESKIATIETILTSPEIRANYLPSQIKVLQENLKNYNSQLLTHYKQFRNTITTWGNSLKTMTLQKTAQEAQTLNKLAHDYEDVRSHYTDLFEQLDQFDQTLNEQSKSRIAA
jgi:hypothetical protein